MKIIDISWPIRLNMTEYKDVKSVVFHPTKTMQQHGVRQSSIAMSNHTGTHVDAPAHFINEGVFIEDISLTCLIGACRVLDMTSIQEKITVNDLEAFAISQDQIILFKTRNSLHNPHDFFDYNFVYLESSGADFLARQSVKAVGIDYLGIERNQPNHATHTALMRKNIPIIEGLRLEHVQPGNYFLCCLPLACIGLDAAPARAILIDEIHSGN